MWGEEREREREREKKPKKHIQKQIKNNFYAFIVIEKGIGEGEENGKLCGWDVGNHIHVTRWVYKLRKGWWG